MGAKGKILSLNIFSEVTVKTEGLDFVLIRNPFYSPVCWC